MYKVLVVDDEVPIRQWLEFCIDRMDGYELVGSASNGAEGYSLFRRKHPDIIITDIRMPGVNGLEMIEMIRNLEPSVYVLVLTSHEEFSYARRAMQSGVKDYILKTEISEETLGEMLSKGTHTLAETGMAEDRERIAKERKRLLCAAVRGENESGVSPEKLKQCGLDDVEGTYAVLAVRGNKELSGAGHKLEEELQKDLCEREGAEYIRIYSLLPELECTVMIVGFSNNTSVSLLRQREVIHSICGDIMRREGVAVGVSTGRNDPAKIAAAVKRAYDSSFVGFYNRRQRVFYEEEYADPRVEKEENYKIRFNREMINQNYTKVFSIMEEMKEAVRKERPYPVEDVKELYLFFMVTLLHFVQDDIDRLEKQIEGLKEKVAKIDSLEELEELTDRVFDKLLKSGENQEWSHPVRAAIEYMEENYGRQINLSEVAGLAGLSSEYLSRIFKEETGIKFIVYLNNIRLKHALNLLESTNMKVYEIAEKVGYSNLSYFSTVFKKNFGINPFEYRKTGEKRL